MKTYYVYILASKRNGTLYVGVTSNLVKRVSDHKSHVEGSFTSKYNVGSLVYYEATNSIEAAILREKQLKHWNRAWKIELIEADNPEWSDLSVDI